MSGPSWTAQFIVFGEVSGSVDPCERGSRRRPRTRRMDPDRERLWLSLPSRSCSHDASPGSPKASQGAAKSPPQNTAEVTRPNSSSTDGIPQRISVIWSRDHKSLLMLPLPEEQSLGGHHVELQLHVAVPEASEANLATIGLRVDDGSVENFSLSSKQCDPDRQIGQRLEVSRRIPDRDPLRRRLRPRRGR